MMTAWALHTLINVIHVENSTRTFPWKSTTLILATSLRFFLVVDFHNRDVIGEVLDRRKRDEDPSKLNEKHSENGMDVARQSQEAAQPEADENNGQLNSKRIGRLNLQHLIAFRTSITCPGTS